MIICTCFLVATHIGSNKNSEDMRDSIHSFLRSIPRGLTLGHSLAKDGQLGLWCVGRVLQKGTLLGLKEPDQMISKEKSEEVCLTVRTDMYLLLNQQWQVLLCCFSSDTVCNSCELQVRTK